MKDSYSYQYINIPIDIRGEPGNTKIQCDILNIDVFGRTLQESINKAVLEINEHLYDSIVNHGRIIEEVISQPIPDDCYDCFIEVKYPQILKVTK